jgi:hypothetical protein
MDDLLSALRELNQHDKLSLDEVQARIQETPQPAIRLYLQSLIFESKPEDTLEQLLRAILLPLAGHRLQSEAHIGGGFIDLLFRENRQNPVLMELKPLFVAVKDDGKTVSRLMVRPLRAKQYAGQVRKYLRDHDYLMLTNGREVQCFNRDIFTQEEAEPFATVDFCDLVEQYQETLSFWEILRRLDGEQPRPTLEREFFLDLEHWYDTLSETKFSPNATLPPEELIVLLLNKIIFIKTLEDYALIPFNFALDTYTDLEERWRTKGTPSIFKEYFNAIDNWCWMYYDTELFNIKFWEQLDQSRTALNQFQPMFEKVLGAGTWEVAFGKGMVHYDYRKIDEDVFGKAYETFIAKQRKDSGIYYTHRLITQYMSERLIERLFTAPREAVMAALDANDTDAARRHMQALQAIRITDTCAGSGSFLIKALREIHDQYLKIARHCAWVNDVKTHNGGDLLDITPIPPHVLAIQAFRAEFFLDDPRRLLASIILHHIHAIDIDGRALDTAKTNVWKEAIKLSPAAFHHSRLPEELNHILPNLTLNCVEGDALLDLPLAEQVDFLVAEHRADIAELQRLRRAYLDHPTQPQVLDEIPDIKKKLRAALLAQAQDELFQALLPRRKPILLALEFFYLFFDENGAALPEEQWGFDGILSNPPWEVIKAFQKEFAKVGKYKMDILNFEKWFKSKQDDEEEFRKGWKEYHKLYEDYKNYLRSTCQYQGSGDLNFYKSFIERDLQIIKPYGYLSILVPSGIQTDKGCQDLRELLIFENTLTELFSFENKGFKEKPEDKHKSKIFPDVHPQFKFSIVNAQKNTSGSHALRGNPEAPRSGVGQADSSDESAPQRGASAFPRGAWERETYDFDALFYLRDPRDVYSAKPIKVNAKMIGHFSPETFSIMEFPSEEIYFLCKRIRAKHHTLSDKKISLKREFHMTDDKKLFEIKKNKNSLALYEGKNIFQYDSNFSQVRYFLDEEKAKKTLIKKEIYKINKEFSSFIDEDSFFNNVLALEYQRYKLVFRDVASSTNERTLIASLLPPNIFTGNTLTQFYPFFYYLENDNLKQSFISYTDILLLLAALNSLVLNFYIRNKISSHASFYYMYELPIPTCPNKLKKEITEKSLALLQLKNPPDWYEPLREELKLAEISEKTPQFALQTRAELEVLIARELYGLSAADWDYLTATFIYGGESATKQELDAIIALSKQLYVQ